METWNKTLVTSCSMAVHVMFVRGKDGELIILTWIPAMRPTASATRYLPYSITRAQCDVTRHRCRHGRNHCDGHCVCSCCLCLLACCVCSVIVSYTGSERLLWIVHSILPFLPNICLHSQACVSASTTVYSHI